MQAAERPVPVASADSAPYWEGARRGELVLPRCCACGRAWFPPSASCPHCSALDHEWAAVSGRGTVVTFTVVHRAPAPAFAAHVPYVIAILELQEGPRLLANVVDCAPADVRIGMPVEVTFEQRGPDATVPQFRPARRD